MSTTSSFPAVEMVGISKSFPGVQANRGVDLRVMPGEVLALIGENGAGKTTLMSILYGLLQPDEGTIGVRGRRVSFSSPADAIAVGLGMVHQSFKLFEPLTVAENVVYGREPRRHGFVDAREAVRQVEELAERYGLAVEPTAIVSKLSVGIRQRVEILKALYREASILILDEPTAVLTPGETRALFGVLRTMAESGHSVILVTHKLHEVMAVSDRVSVLRDGQLVSEVRTADTSPRQIAADMTGREMLFESHYRPSAPAAPVLRVERLSVSGRTLASSVKDVSFDVRSGEIVGIAGVAGNGQEELVEALAGLRRPKRGRVLVGDADVTARSVAEHRRAGLAYVPEDRNRRGTAPPATVWENLIMGRHRDRALSWRGQVLRRTPALEHARELTARFDIRAASVRTKVGTLSGGNVQKIVLARELLGAAAVIIAEQPTRGLDIGAAEFVLNELLRSRDEGSSVLLVSYELPELVDIADRILVMFCGRVVGELPRAEFSEERLGLLMAGVASDHAGPMTAVSEA